jgi:hypothetical protein
VAAGSGRVRFIRRLPMALSAARAIGPVILLEAVKQGAQVPRRYGCSRWPMEMQRPDGEKGPAEAV